VHARGFFTDPELEEGEVIGYRMRSLDGREAWVAHISDAGPIRVGRFKVNVPEIDFVATQSLLGPIFPDRVFLVDELGRIALASRRLESAVKDAFASGAHIVATVEDRPVEFVETLRRLAEVEMVSVTAADFDEVRERVLASLRPSTG